MQTSSINSIYEKKYSYNQNQLGNKQKAQKQQVSFGNGAETFIHAIQAIQVFGLLTITGIFASILKRDNRAKNEKANSSIIDVNKKTVVEVSEKAKFAKNTSANKVRRLMHRI